MVGRQMRQIRRPRNDGIRAAVLYLLVAQRSVAAAVLPSRQSLIHPLPVTPHGPGRLGFGAVAPPPPWERCQTRKSDAALVCPKDDGQARHVYFLVPKARELDQDTSFWTGHLAVTVHSLALQSPAPTAAVSQSVRYGRMDHMRSSWHVPPVFLFCVHLSLAGTVQ